MSNPTGPEMQPSQSSSSRTSGVVSAAQTSNPIEGQYIVVFDETVANVRQAASDLARAEGGSLRHVYGHALNGFSLKIDEAGARRLAQRGQVAYVEQDQEVQAIAQTIPAGIDRIEVDLNSTAKVDNTDDAMDVDLAIIDTGIDLDHPDLDPVDAVNCIDAGASADDDNGHGTHVAGSAAAIDNTSQVVGIAPGARVHAVKVLDSGGSGSISSVVCGIDYATEHAGTIEVANMSLGTQGQSETLRSSLQNSVSAGVVHVVSAGNSGADVYGSDGTFGTSDDYIPAAYPEVAAVSAMAEFDGSAGGDGGSKTFTGCGKIEDDTFAGCFSNYSTNVVSTNPVSSPGAAIDLAAPGVSVLSTTPDGGTGRKTGTSMSSPHVAGAAALEIVTNGRDRNGDGVIDESDVYDVRQTMVDNGQAQSQWQSGNTRDPDGNNEALVFVGSSDNLPNVSWVNPTDGETVSGTVTLEADASDDNGVSIVEFLVDGSKVGEDTDGSDGWTYDWDSSTASDGDHDLTARATDDAGQTSSSTITVTVDNAASSDVPAVDALSLSEDNGGGSPHAEFDASWQVSDVDGDLDRIELTLYQLDSSGNRTETEDSASIDVSGSGASGTTGFKAKFDENSGATYEVELIVTDTSGNSASDTATETEDGS